MRRRRYLALTGSLSLTLAGCTESAQNDPENSEEPTVESDGGDVEVLSDADVAVIDVEYEGHWSGSVGNAGSVRTVEGEGADSIDVPLEDTENGQLFLQLDDGRDERTVRADIGKDDGGTGTLTVRISLDGDVVSEGSTTEGSDRVGLSVTVVRSGESSTDESDNETTEQDNDSEPEAEPPEENATEESDDSEEQNGDNATDEPTEDETADSDNETGDSEGSTGSSTDETSDETNGSDGASDATESDGPESDDTAGTADDSDQSADSEPGSPNDVEGSEPGTEESTDDASDTESTQDDE